jgi:hypothetical protein
VQLYGRELSPVEAEALLEVLSFHGRGAPQRDRNNDLRRLLEAAEQNGDVTPRTAPEIKALKVSLRASVLNEQYRANSSFIDHAYEIGCTRARRARTLWSLLRNVSASSVY